MITATWNKLVDDDHEDKNNDDKYDKQIKRSISSRVEMMNGYWVARSVTMFNLVSNRLSNMAMVSLHMGLTVSEDFLTQRSLTDNAYRESVLNQLRSQTK